MPPKSQLKKGKLEKKLEVISEVEEKDEDTTTEIETETTIEAEVERIKRKRQPPTRETLLQGFEDLQKFIEDEITRRRAEATKIKGVKFLRSVNKRVKLLKAQMSRMTKQRTRTNRKSNANSGFQKAVKVSKEMAEFAGWDQKELHSRVDVTKLLCEYIKRHDLQNPDDRRQISVDKDPKLKKLLGYDAKKDKLPLTYCRMQTYLKKHFIKE